MTLRKIKLLIPLFVHLVVIDNLKLFLFLDFDFRYFWEWTDFVSYIECIAVFTVFTGLLTYAFLDSVSFCNSKENAILSFNFVL